MKYMKYLKTFEQQNNDIKKLVLSYKNLTELPPLPDSLEQLFCNNNQLTELPPLPDSLEYLHCYDNQLTKLPTLPDSLKVLSCSYNQLTELPDLYDHPNLKKLWCNVNKLPYNNLIEYKQWYEKRYPERIKAKKFNL